MYLVKHHVEVSSVPSTHFVGERDDVVVGKGPLPSAKPRHLPDAVVHFSDDVDHGSLAATQQSKKVHEVRREGVQKDAAEGVHYPVLLPTVDWRP